jgi:hypothetical protein
MSLPMKIENLYRSYFIEFHIHKIPFGSFYEYFGLLLFDISIETDNETFLTHE